MASVWDPKEAQAKVYREVERHSDGMISFEYQPPSESDVVALKDTKTYRRLQHEQASVVTADTPEEVKAGI